MVNLKMNGKGSYDSFECKSCNNSEETQKHIYDECIQIRKEEKEYIGDIPEYDCVMKGDITEKFKVAKIFKEKLKIHEKIAKSIT